MAIQINITPSIANNGSGMPTTTLELNVDVSKILEMLKEYNLLLKIRMVVNSINVATQEIEVNIYEFAQIYKDVTNPSIIITTIVWGNVTDINNIDCVAEGVFVNK